MAVTAVRDMILNLRENRQGHALLEVANDLDKTAKGADRAGDAFARMRQDAVKLNAEIDQTKAKVKDLYTQFARTGDRSLFGDIRAAEQDLRRLQRTLANVSETGIQVTNNFGKQLSETFGGLGGKAAPILIGTLVGAAVAAAPTIGAILAGGIAGAAGTGAMAAGILSAAKDEQVRAAASQFGRDISAEFFGGGQAFVEPVIDALDILRKGFADLHLGDALAEIAPTVTVIAKGLADAGRLFMPGFLKFLERSGPFAETAARGLADMGDTLGDFLDEVTQSRGSLEGLEALFRLVNGTIRILGVSLNFLSDRFHEWNFIQAKVFRASEQLASAVGFHKAAEGAGLLADMFERTVGIGGNLHGMFRKLGTEAVDPFAGYLQDAWRQMERLREEAEATNRALTDYFHIVMSLDQAQLAVNKGLFELKEALKENGRHWEANTEAGIANREALLQQIGNLERLREAEIAAGGDTGQANAKFFEQTKQLLAIAKQAGATKEYLEQLEREYVIKFAIYGAVTAGAQKIIDSVNKVLYGGGGGGTIQVNTGRPTGESFASGGVTPAFAPFRVHDGEMLWSSKQHYVSTAAQTKALTPSGGSVKAVLSAEGVSDPALRAIVQLLLPHFRVEIQGLGGAQAAFN